MKQLIILVCTVPLGTQSEIKARTRLSEFKAIMEKTFDQELQDQTNTIIKTIVLAGHSDQDAKMECIYPVAPSFDVLNKLEEIMIKQQDWKI